MSYDLRDVKDDFGLIADGEYEAFLDVIQIKQAGTGTKYINVQVRIRDDIEQAHQNRVLFDAIWENKSTGVFNRQRLTRILKACFPENTPLNFEGVDEILETIAGQKLRIVVKTEYDDYNDEDVNKIHYYKPTKNPDKTIAPTQSGGYGRPATPEEELQETADNVITNDDDLPF